MAEKEQIPPLERQSSSMLRTNSNLEKKMMDMRERFRMLQLMEEIEGKDDTNTNVDSPAGTSTKTTARPTSASPPPQNLAALRWNKLRKVVRTHSNLQTLSKSDYDSPRSARLDSDDEDTKGAKHDSKEDFDDDYSISQPPSSKPSRPTSGKGSRPPSGRNRNKKSTKKLEQEDQQLADLWNKDSFFQPYEYDKVAQPDLTLPPIPISDIELKFEEEADPLKLEISRIPEPAIQEKKDTIEKGLFAQHQANIETIKKLQTDVIWREDLARKRVIEMENKTKERILIERSKMIKSALDREKNMGQQFRKAREELEEGIRRQEAAVKEHFGRVLVHNESLARRFFVFTKMFPQPIEFRIHLMRAVKDKLPKGAYVLMLTQYDRLGGNPLIWSEIGANGIGKMRPGITKIVRHQGRYYDRVVRFEDSCFALCPPRPRIKPGYIFVLELFQLASHKNPHDKIVAWSAIPMSYESMNIIEGKFKLPMLRGEHTAKIQHFREMESSIASDLSNWLCNIYIEVRHMSLHELGATEEMLKSADFDLDYFNKTVLNDSYLKNHNAALEAKKGEKLFGTDKHKEVIAKSPFTPIDLVLPPSASEDVLFQRRQFSNENSRDEELDELDRLEKQIIKEEQEEAGKDKNKAKDKKEKKESEEDGVPLLQLPVDKGIFRRKVHQNIDTARDTTEGAGGGNVNSANYSHSSVSAQHNNSATYSDGDDEEKQKKNKKAGKAYDQRNSSFLDSWLIMLGLKRNVQETAFRSADSQQKLQSNDSFLEHKKQLLKKWKENVEKKFPKHNSPTHEDEFDKDEVVDIRERGYHLQDEAFLHKHQRGKLMGLETIEKRDNRQWAQATLEGKIVRKWQSDGPRFDTEAIRNGKKGDNEVSPRDDGPPSPLRGYYSPRSGKKRFFAEAPMQGAGRGKGDANGVDEDDESREFDDNWEELRDPREMQDYQMSIVADPTSRKHLIPGAIAASKIRYLTQELFGDLVPTSFGTFEFYMTILLYLFTFWMRIYVHYLAQYLYILAQNTPVYAFSLNLLYIMFKYSSSSISEAVEVGIVAIGPVANICVFLFMAMFGTAFYKFSGFLPDAFSKLFAYYGVATILDPVLTILVDLCYGHYACFNHSTICAEDYTSADCKCYNGDFVKLWYRVEVTEGTGLTGLFITLMIYLGTGVLSCLILHEYLLHVHRDGRILDLWRRVNAPMEEFFIPDDYEISAEELTKILNAARSFKGVLPGVIIKRNIVFHEGIEKDPNDPNFLASYKRIIIYQNESSGKQFIFRHFLMDHSGKITEIFNDSNVKASDLLPKRAFQGLINKDANINNNTNAVTSGIAAAATDGTIALPPDSSRKSDIDKEDREEKVDEERRNSNASERKTVIKVSNLNNDDEVVTNPMVPSLKNMPTSYPPTGSVPSSARSIGKNLPTPSNPLPRGLLPPSQLSSHLNSANVSPRAGENELEDMDEDLNVDLLPREEDYQHQEELIKQKRKQLKLRDEVELGDDYYNEDRHENDDEEDDYDQGGMDDDEALLANQPKIVQKKKFSPLRRMIKQPNK